MDFHTSSKMILVIVSNQRGVRATFCWTNPRIWTKTIGGGVKRNTNNFHKNAPRKITHEIYHVMTLQDTTNLILCVTVVPKL